MSFFTANNMDFAAKRVTWMSPSTTEYTQGKEYWVLVQKMTDGRIAVFKSSQHYNEEPGYKVYATMDDIKNDFTFKE